MTQNDLPAWATDPECPWWAKLRRAEYLIDEIDEQYRALKTPGVGWRVDHEIDGDQALVYRLRLLRPVSADFAALVGDAVHNLRSSLDQVAYHLAVQHSGPLTADAERMSEFPIRITGDKFDDWATGR